MIGYYVMDATGIWQPLVGTPVDPGSGGTPAPKPAMGFDTDGVWSTKVTDLGAPQCRRSFDSGLVPTTWAASAAGTDTTTTAVPLTIYSFKATPSSFKTGVNDANVLAFLNDVPAGHQTIITLWHEPENDIKSGTFTLADWQASINHLGDLVHSRSRPELRNSIITMGNFTFDPSQPFGDPEQYWDPGFDTSVDVIGFDCYFKLSAGKTIPYGMQPCEDWATTHAKPMMVPELGMNEDPTDVNRKADAMAELYQRAKDHAYVAVAYFDVSSGTHASSDPSYLLESSPQATAEWKSIQLDSGS